MGYRTISFEDNEYYHVYNRGNERRDIFFEPSDYLHFLDKIVLYGEKDKVSVVCFCLMPNHYHLLLSQREGGSISAYIHRLQTSFSMYLNIKHKRVGHLFQGPFKAKLILDDSYMLQLSKYIHLNPVEIGQDYKEYLWSSYPAYLARRRANVCKTLDKRPILDYFMDATYPSREYARFVASSDPIPDEVLSQD
jgi:REP element-mobilizing transposase RayT